nr:hypothetical protein CFP56_38908 [Quercus suber]
MLRSSADSTNRDSFTEIHSSSTPSYRWMHYWTASRTRQQQEVNEKVACLRRCRMSGAYLRSRVGSKLTFRAANVTRDQQCGTCTVSDHNGIHAMIHKFYCFLTQQRDRPFCLKHVIDDMSSKFWTWSKGDPRAKEAAEALRAGGVVAIPVDCITITGMDHARHIRVRIACYGRGESRCLRQS